MKNYYRIDGLKPITNLEDARYYISYGDFVAFVGDNCNIEDDNEKWEYSENIADGVSDGSSTSFYNLDSLKKETYMVERGFREEKEWLLKFFKAHSFMKRIGIVFDD